MAKKRVSFPAPTEAPVPVKIAAEEENTSISTPSTSLVSVPQSTKSFKLAAYAAKCVKPETNKPRVIKNLKQVTTAERLYPSGVASYASIEMHQTMKPAKKYSDISGLPAKYTDPLTKLYYADSEEFAKIRLLSSEQVLGYLSLRRANVPMS
ncbi:INO80 complex subunit C [Galendromus occidentalis]|uniref:INO80 complex subunit C n=1 Tax=Galendromus occidentalis TaxID=34638 RepID=A0AAJ6QUC5_9ACAR|nr:INO80 complex subunit C [Galendromus occidentalis]